MACVDVGSAAGAGKGGVPLLQGHGIRSRLAATSLHSRRCAIAGAPAPPPLPAVWWGVQTISGQFNTSDDTFGVLVRAVLWHCRRVAGRIKRRYPSTSQGERYFTTKFDEQGDLLWQRDVMTFDASLMALQPEFAELLGVRRRTAPTHLAGLP